MVAKDNHVPLIDIPTDDNVFKPDPNNIDINPSDNINTWAKGLATHRYAPGNPDGIMNYNFACKQFKNLILIFIINYLNN